MGAYLVGAADARRAIVVAADAPGWRAKGARRFARRLAADGTLVVTPDLWRGDTWYGDPSPAARAKTDDFREWARGHRPANAAADLRAVVAALRERGAERVAVVGLGLGANAVANLAAAGNEAGEEKVEASAETTRETTTPEASPASSASADRRGDAHSACALVCAMDLDAVAAGETAAAKPPALFVWGGGEEQDAARVAIEFIAEERAGDAEEGKWASEAFADAAADFAFAEEGDEAAERAAAELVLRWMFREEAGDPTSAEGNAKTTTAQG